MLRHDSVQTSMPESGTPPDFSPCPQNVMAVVPCPSMPRDRQEEVWTEITSALNQHWTQDATSGTLRNSVRHVVTTRYYRAVVNTVLVDARDCAVSDAICIVLDPSSTSMAPIELQELLKSAADIAQCKLLISMNSKRDEDLDWDVSQLTIQYGFEIVHWQANESQDRWDRVGVERMLEALEATLWRDMEMLGNNPRRIEESDSSQDDDASDVAGDEISFERYTEPHSPSLDGADFAHFVKAPIPIPPDSVTDAPADDLDSLFSQFTNMREMHKTTASREQRHSMAEQVALRMWKAWGIDDEELYESTE